MRRIVTGEQVARLYNPDPFALPVWRAPVYRTPAWVVILGQLPGCWAAWSGWPPGTPGPRAS